MNRRNLIELAIASSCLGLVSCQAEKPPLPSKQNQGTKFNPTPNTNANANLNRDSLAKFNRWIKTLQPAGGLGLVTYMNEQKNNGYSLSTIASAKLLMLYININDIPSAVKVANGLVKWWQQVYKQGTKHTKGGMPTEIILTKSGNSTLGNYFYAGDNLIVIHALYRMYQLTNQSVYAEVAQSIGKWMEQTLFDGVRYNVWKNNYGMPMHYLRDDGAVDNTIYTAVDFLWLRALNDLHALDNRHGWQQRFEKALDFMQNAQMPSGAWYTYFKPEVGSNKGKWYGYNGENITIGDDNLRAGLAAIDYGMKDKVEHFSNWLKPYNDTMLWGYLKTEVCEPKFLPTDKPYFDVVCTGILRSWYDKRGQHDLAKKCQTQLDALQGEDGGWFWAVTQQDMKPLNSEKAVITSCWAVTNLV